MNSYRIEET